MDHAVGGNLPKQIWGCKGKGKEVRSLEFGVRSWLFFGGKAFF